MILIKNQVIFITGGCGLIGEQIVAKLSKNNNIVIFDKNKEYGNILIQKYGENNNIIFCYGTITDINSIDNAIKQCANKFKKLDAVIHCAYPKSEQWGRKLEDLKANYLKEDLFNQLGGTILLVQRSFEYFKKVKIGNIILLASIQGLGAPKFEHYEDTTMVSPIEYTAIKSGIITITKYLSKYFKDYNIKVNCISPGGIKSNQPKSFLSEYKKSCLNKGMLDSEDIIGAIKFLLSDESMYIAGQNLIVDDGWSL